MAVSSLSIRSLQHQRIQHQRDTALTVSTQRRFKRFACCWGLLASALISPLTSTSAWADETDNLQCQGAMALHGEPVLPDDFKHLPYVNPEAPKGGHWRQGAIGTFDSLNPFIIKGTPAADTSTLLYDTLTVQSLDEPFTEYGLVAKCMRLDPQNRWIEFKLRPEARFNDGEPITADDVIFSFNTLKAQGRPFFRAYYHDVAEVSAPDEHTVRFEFANTTNRELPMILGQLPVLPQHYWHNKDFTAPTLDIPIGSGPYRISHMEPGRKITYARVKDYWGKDLPINVGRFNVDRQTFDYYRDQGVALEAFKAGRLDFRLENSASQWAESYNGAALDQGEIVKEQIRHHNPAPMQGFVYNTRRAPFDDPKVRAALLNAFDFEWTNKQLFHGAYQRLHSYFDNSELASHGVPKGEELALLTPWKDQLPDALFNTPYQLPVTQGDGNIRRQLHDAMRQLKSAGWTMQGGKLVKDGKPFEFEMLLVSSQFERIVLPMKRNLQRMGIDMKVRLVDTTQYLNRLRDFDFDMTVSSFPQSLSPGNEQRDFWGSANANRPDSRNLAGVASPVVDDLINKVIHANSREQLVTRVHALDRVLLWGNYMIPQFYLDSYRIARSQKLQHPEQMPRYGIDLDSWWIKPESR